jgi:hypothetical protein
MEFGVWSMLAGRLLLKMALVLLLRWTIIG